jgi:hypothetical protein
VRRLKIRRQHVHDAADFGVAVEVDAGVADTSKRRRQRSRAVFRERDGQVCVEMNHAASPAVRTAERSAERLRILARRVWMRVLRRFLYRRAVYCSSKR